MNQPVYEESSLEFCFFFSFSPKFLFSVVPLDCMKSGNDLFTGGLVQLAKTAEKKAEKGINWEVNTTLSPELVHVLWCSLISHFPPPSCTRQQRSYTGSREHRPSISAPFKGHSETRPSPQVESPQPLFLTIAIPVVVTLRSDIVFFF